MGIKIELYYCFLIKIKLNNKQRNGDKYCSIIYVFKPWHVGYQNDAKKTVLTKHWASMPFRHVLYGVYDNLYYFNSDCDIVT